MERNVRVTKFVNQRSEMFSGPIPDPESLKKYDSIQSGLADRLVKLAEEEQRQRQNLNRMVIENEIVNQKEVNNLYGKGQWYALIAITQVLIVCGIAFYLGYPSASRDIAVVVIVALASVFMGKGLQGKRTSDSSKEN